MNIYILMPKFQKFIIFNVLINILGILYQYIYTNQSILFCYLYCVFYHYMFVNILDYITKNNKRITENKYIPDIYYIFNVSVVGFTELLTIHICNQIKTDNIIYDFITLIPKLFIYEIIFDFFHYWTHRISHHKYLYYFHKTHHEHKSNLSVYSTYNHNIFDLIFTNVIPMYLTSNIIILSEYQFFIFLILKTFIEISGHSGSYIKNSSFIQCIWIPKIFGIELYARDHYLHHTKFNYNYSKRFILWDKIFNTYTTDKEIIKKENVLFDNKSIIIQNVYIRNILFILFLWICYIL